MDIGIDLGTTFSVIAVKGRPTLVDGYPDGEYLAHCDVTVIRTPLGETSFPSVFWVNPENAQDVLIGTEAKQKALEGDSPIMFSKRSIGTDEQLKIGARSYSARQVATELLAQMKRWAEQALGQPVRRAVITHPAYFDRNQVTETKEAAEAAGFDMRLPEQMMMEPAAAALAFLQGETKDPMRVMTYDLGGGTFDVTVVERRQGVISIRAYDGDHLLGGYNFDRELIQWVLERLKAGGRVIPYDDSDPVDRGRRARLLHIAETVKLRLSEQRTAKVPVEVKAQDVLVDSDGRNVLFAERITGETYALLIKDHLDKTIACCRRALEKAGMGADELDMILLVGGSTRGPWVQDALKQAFNVKTESFDPDLCVAAGAAIQAAGLPPVASGSDLELILHVPSVSVLPTVTVAGQVRAPSGERLKRGAWDGLSVALTRGAEKIGSFKLRDNEARFAFSDMELLADGPTDFIVHVIDAKGVERLTHSFAITYGAQGGPEPISISLPKPLYLETTDGMQLIAEEGRPLPTRCEIKTKMRWNESEVSIPVYQDDAMIGEIHVDGIPPEAGAGSLVVVNVEITENNEIRGDAKVLQRGGSAVVAQRPVHVKFPPLVLPELPELRAEFEALEDRRRQLAVLSDDPEERLALEGKGAKLAKTLGRLFAEQAPDRQEIYRAKKELDVLVNPPKDDMEPPRAQFRQLIDATREMLLDGSDAQLVPLRTMLKQIEADGNDAFTTKNHKKWGTTNESLAKLHQKVIMLLNPRGERGGGDLPPAPVLKGWAQQSADALRATLAEECRKLESLPAYAVRIKPRADAIAAAIDKIEADIDKVADDLEPNRAWGLLQVALRSEQQLKQGIHDLKHSVTKV